MCYVLQTCCLTHLAPIFQYPVLEQMSGVRSSIQNPQFTWAHSVFEDPPQMAETNEKT